MKIIGIRIEKYIDKKVSGHNCDFQYNDAEFTKHIICAVHSDNRKLEIELSRFEGECGSGWCTASFANINITEVERFGGYSHIPKNILYIDDLEPGFSYDTSNEVFNISQYGYDDYYPSGSYYVNMNLFNETSRNMNLRPVWIFKGGSNYGKSFIASKLKDIDVYETDSNDILPDSITSTVIILGNKYTFAIEDITEKLFGDVDVHIVDFTKHKK